ncbi:hypothetical protein BLOT_006491 [Blomia tropicalis]|nr:hypothetical protein BLOT_006491 [Blomia tropicalis]
MSLIIINSRFHDGTSLKCNHKVQNEPILGYEPGSKERTDLRKKLDFFLSDVTDIPIVIDGKHYRTENFENQVCPFDHGHVLAKYHMATKELSEQAIQASLARAREWENVDINDRVNALLKAADLVSGKYRQDLNAATMLGQAKTIIQAEIDSACELADFFRFNAYYVQEVFKYQPISPSEDIKNRFRLRGLEGFVAAISPFNFTAISGNLCSAPALMGNAVVWKPSDTSMLSSWVVYKVLEEANFAPGVISFLPSKPMDFSNNVISSPDLAAVNFTGSVNTFRTIWKNVAANLDTNKTFPRMVGECGGKDFHLLHPSADLSTAIPQTVRAAFEYSGQKCSACSRLYVPSSIWPLVEQGLLEITSKLKLGSPLEFDTFLSAVIDGASFKRIKLLLDFVKSDSTHTILAGGNASFEKGFFVEPTIILTTDPHSKLLTNEIFGPVLTVYVFDDAKMDETMTLIDQSTPYALTGSIFATDKQFLRTAIERLKYSAGNLYINDKCTGAVVGQQPFGGSRVSGTNDKAGAPQYLLRWVSPQNIKQTFVPITDWSYPYMSLIDLYSKYESIFTFNV